MNRASERQATFWRFNGSLLSITIGFTDERVAGARSNAYDVFGARHADYSARRLHSDSTGIYGGHAGTRSFQRNPP